MGQTRRTLRTSAGENRRSPKCSDGEQWLGPRLNQSRDDGRKGRAVIVQGGRGRNQREDARHGEHPHNRGEDLADSPRRAHHEGEAGRMCHRGSERHAPQDGQKPLVRGAGRHRPCRARRGGVQEHQAHPKPADEPAGLDAAAHRQASVCEELPRADDHDERRCRDRRPPRRPRPLWRAQPTVRPGVKIHEDKGSPQREATAAAASANGQTWECSARFSRRLNLVGHSQVLRQRCLAAAWLPPTASRDGPWRVRLRGCRRVRAGFGACPTLVCPWRGRSRPWRGRARSRGLRGRSCSPSRGS